MQKRVYQFEIVRGVSNAVYEAKDTARGMSVMLYEWTPDARELEGCLKVLNGLGKTGEYEVFSSGASLYLAAATERAGEAGLKRLREAGLFKGIFVGAGLAAPPPPPPPPPRVPAVPVKQGKRWKSAERVLIIVVITVVGLLTLLWLAGALR